MCLLEHQNFKILLSQKSIQDKKAKENAKIQEKLAKQSSIPRCKAILKCGKNTGKCCDRIISIDGASFCKIHS